MVQRSSLARRSFFAAITGAFAACSAKAASDVSPVKRECEVFDFENLVFLSQRFFDSPPTESFRLEVWFDGELMARRTIDGVLANGFKRAGKYFVVHRATLTGGDLGLLDVSELPSGERDIWHGKLDVKYFP